MRLDFYNIISFVIYKLVFLWDLRNDELVFLWDLRNDEWVNGYYMRFTFHLFLMELLVRAVRWWENPLGFPVLLKSRPRESRTMILCRNFKVLQWQSINGMKVNVLHRFFSSLIAYELVVSLIFVFLFTNLPMCEDLFLYFLHIVIKISWLVDLPNYQNGSWSPFMH